MELDYKALGRRILKRRKEKGLTQTVLAGRAGIEPSNVSHIERAATKVSLGTLVNIANALDCSMDDLLCDSIAVEREAFHHELAELTTDCSPLELRLITDMVGSLKQSLRQRGVEKK